MTISTSEKISIEYQSNTIKRAEIALFCSIFNLALFLTMLDQSIFLLSIGGIKGYEKGYTKKLFSQRKVEGDLMWLIKVGILRREVDGQGITDSFRLTPLGKQIIQKWAKQKQNFPIPSWGDRLINFFNRLISLFTF